MRHLVTIAGMRVSTTGYSFVFETGTGFNTHRAEIGKDRANWLARLILSESGEFAVAASVLASAPKPDRFATLGRSLVETAISDGIGSAEVRAAIRSFLRRECGLPTPATPSQDF